MTEVFTVFASDLYNRTHRIDPHFFNPIYFDTLDEINKCSMHSTFASEPLGNLLKDSRTGITGGATPKGTPYVSEDEGIKFIRVQNVRDFVTNTEDIVYIPKIIHETELRRSRLKANDVLLTITGVTYGYSAIVPENIGEANINQHLVRIKIDENKIYPQYLSCFLNCELAKVQMDRLVTGGTRPALDYPSIKEITILYPKSKEIQKSITNKTMDLVEKAYNKLNEKKLIYNSIDEKIIRLLGLNLPDKRLEKNFLADITNSDRIDARIHSPYYKEFLEILEKYPSKPLRQLVKLMDSARSKFLDIYTIVDLRDIEEKTGRYIKKEVMDLDNQKIVLQQGLIYVSCLNPTKGKSLLVDKSLDGSIVSNEFTPIKVISDEIIPEYLIAILRSKIALTQWEYTITGSTPSRERIGEKELLKTLIPIPKRDVNNPENDLQNKIAKTILTDIKRIDELDAGYNYYILHAKDTFYNELISLVNE